MTSEDGCPLTIGGNDEEAKMDARIVRKVTIRKSPYGPLCQSGEFETGMTEGDGMWSFLDQALCNLGTDPIPGSQDDARGDPCPCQGLQGQAQRLAGMTNTGGIIGRLEG